MIKLIDNFFEEKIHYDIWDYCNSVSYRLGEKDRDNTSPIGGVFEIRKDNNLFSFLDKSLKYRFNELRDLDCYRSYINFFSPNENPYFHYDNDKGYTCLFYPNLNYELDEGGETQFLVDSKIEGILPIPNRMVLFDANLHHKATSYRTKHRFTIAIKYY
jgi:hypothetical protein